MTFKMCMGNPRNRGQCANCARLPTSKDGTLDDDFKAWVNWKKVASPCEDWIEVGSE